MPLSSPPLSLYYAVVRANHAAVLAPPLSFLQPQPRGVRKGEPANSGARFARPFAPAPASDGAGDLRVVARDLRPDEERHRIHIGKCG